jgi:hypothetical protein
MIYSPKCIDLDETIKKIKNRKITLREVTGQGIAGHQGFNGYNCRTSCATKKCACNKADILCSSKCHGNQNGLLLFSYLYGLLIFFFIR